MHEFRAISMDHTVLHFVAKCSLFKTAQKSLSAQRTFNFLVNRKLHFGPSAKHFGYNGLETSMVRSKKNDDILDYMGFNFEPIQ